MTATDKRELYRTAEVAADTSEFKTGEIVAVRVHYRMEGGWVFTCRRGDRIQDIAEGFLKNFTL